MDPLGTAPEVTYNWVDITSDFFENIKGKSKIIMIIFQKSFITC